MKNILSIALFFIFCLASPAFADVPNNDDTNWGIVKTKNQEASTGEAEESVWDNERDNYIYENYGTDSSSSFLNRSNIDTYESDHGGDSFDLSD